jgi:hypothetical protein
MYAAAAVMEFSTLLLQEEPGAIRKSSEFLPLL